MEERRPAVTSTAVWFCTGATVIPTFVGHPACNADTLQADLHLFAFLLGVGDVEAPFAEPTP